MNMDIVSFIQDIYEQLFRILQVDKLYTYCAELDDMLIVQIRVSEIELKGGEDVKKIYFDEGVEIRIKKNRVGLTCNDIRKLLGFPNPQ